MVLPQTIAGKGENTTTFTIDAENNITAYPNATECNLDLAQCNSQAALAKPVRGNLE